MYIAALRSSSAHSYAFRSQSRSCACAHQLHAATLVNPRRWVVERFFAWIGRNRRLANSIGRTGDGAGDSPPGAHAYRNERGFLDYEFARAKVIEWGESAYAEERYICTQVLFAQLFPGAIKSLTSMCDRLVLDSSERDDRHGALLDADMTADALILLERQLKHGESGAPRSWTSA